jgi:hypothetical protein
MVPFSPPARVSVPCRPVPAASAPKNPASELRDHMMRKPALKPVIKAPCGSVVLNPVTHQTGEKYTIWLPTWGHEALAGFC